MRTTILRRSIPAILLALSISGLSAFDNTLILGEETGWAELASMDNIRIVQGYRGFADLTLRDGEYPYTDDTDILLHFNSTSGLPRSSAYRTINGNTTISTVEKVLGTGAAVFGPNDPGLEWEPQRGSLFGPGSAPGDFTVEFWMFPSVLADGEEFFVWKGMEIHNETILPQSITGRIFRQKISWEFSNFFQNPDRQPSRFIVTGITPLLPRRWHHHLIRYDSRTGLLEYLVNGKPEGISFTTPTGREAAEVYSPRSGSAQPPRVILGGSFSGVLDEFRIVGRMIEEPNLTRYTTNPGYAETRILDLGQSGALFNKLTPTASKENGSAIAYYYRQSDTIFAWDDHRIDWKRITPGALISDGNRGRYLQLKMVLRPNGSGEHSPQLSSLKIDYETALPPLPPMGLTVTAGDGRADLSWNRLGNASTDGYKLYFGTKPGNYFGTTAEGLSSPIDVGDIDKYSLTGLENGTLYYFALTAYGGWEGRLTSEFSEERMARPDNGEAE